MKQTRNAITFLQAQYRALLQRTLWARFASVLSYGAAAGIGVPFLSSTIVVATDQIVIDAAIMDSVAVIDPADIVYDFADGIYVGSHKDITDSASIRDSYTIASLNSLKSCAGNICGNAPIENNRIGVVREFAYQDYGDYSDYEDYEDYDISLDLVNSSTMNHAYTAINAATDVAKATTAVSKRQADGSLHPYNIYNELWLSDIEHLNAFKFDAVHESLLSINHTLGAKQIDDFNLAYQHNNYELSSGSLSAGASVPVFASSADLIQNSVSQRNSIVSAKNDAISSVAFSSAQFVDKDALRVSSGRVLSNVEQKHEDNQAYLLLEHLGQQAIHIADSSEHEAVTSVRLIPPYLGSFAADLVTATALGRSFGSEGSFVPALADQLSLAATNQQIVPISTTPEGDRLGSTIAMNLSANSLASLDASMLSRVTHAPVFMADQQEDNTAIGDAIAKNSFQVSGSKGSVFAPPLASSSLQQLRSDVDTARYLARTNAQGHLQFKSADGTQLSFVPHNSSPQAVKVNLQEPSSFSNLEISDNCKVKSKKESEKGREEESESFACLATSMSEPWLQVILDEGQSYDLMVENDEDWDALVNSLEGANGFEFDSYSPELVFDLRGEGGEQPYTLKIDSSILEAPNTATSFANNDTRSNAIHASESQLHGGLLVSVPKSDVWRNLPELVADVPTNIMSSMKSDFKHDSNAVLDLQHVLYAPNFSNVAQGQMQMEVPLYLGEHTTLFLRDKLIGSSQFTDSLQAASLSSALLQPYVAVKSGRSSVFAPLYENAMDQALTVKLDVVQPTMTSASSRFDERVLSVVPHQKDDAVDAIGQRNDEISLIFRAPSTMPQAISSTTNYMAGREVTNPVRFIVGHDTELKLDMSALTHGSVAIAAYSSKAQDQSRITSAASLSSYADQYDSVTVVTEPDVVVQRDLHSHLLHIAGSNLALAQVDRGQEQSTKSGVSTFENANSLGDLRAVAPLQNVVMLSDDATSALPDYDSLAAMRVDFASVEREHINAVSQAVATSGTNANSIVNSENLVSELAGKFHSQSLRLPQNYQWVEVPSQQILTLYSTPFIAETGNSGNAEEDEAFNGFDRPVMSPPFFLQTPNNANVGVHLQSQAQLHLFGNGSIGSLTGLGKVYLQDANVQVQSRHGIKDDVNVKEISLERSRLQGREIRSTHFSLQNSAIEAQSLIVQGNTAYSSTTDRNAGSLSIGPTVGNGQFKSGVKSKAKPDALLLRESSLPNASGKLPSVPAGSFEIKREQQSGAGSDASSSLYSGANFGINNCGNSGSMSDGSLGSFSAFNSDVHVPYIDLRAAAKAQMQGGSLQAQDLKAHRFSLRDGVSAFVQHIELQGLDSVLSLGSVVEESATSKQEVQSSKVQVKIQSDPFVRLTSPVKSKSKEAKSSRAASEINTVERDPLSLSMPEIPAFIVSELNEPQFNDQINKQLNGAHSLNDLTAAAEQLQQLKWLDQSVKHTSLVAQSLDLGGGLLQLYGAPHEQVTVFTHSLQGRDDYGSSMRLSGNVIIGRNSALGLGNDYNAFAQAYDSYKQRYQQQQVNLKSKDSSSLRSPQDTLVSAKANVTTNTKINGDSGSYSTGAYLYVDRSNIKLGKHKIIMGTEDLSYLQSLLHSPYSIYLGSGSTMQISARALYGQDSNSAKYGSNANVDSKTRASKNLVFSDLNNRTVASSHGQLLVPVNTTSHDLMRIFGSGVNLRSGDVLHVSTENGLFTGKITNSEQLRGGHAFNLTMTGNPREALSDLSTPTFDQVMHIMGTAVHSYTNASLFDTPSTTLSNNGANNVNNVDTMHDTEIVNGNLSDLSSVTADGVTSVFQAASSVEQMGAVSTDIVVTVTDTSVNSALNASNAINVNNTLSSNIGANQSSGSNADAISNAGATDYVAGVVSVNQDVVLTDTNVGNDIVVGSDTASNASTNSSSASDFVSDSGSTASSGGAVSAGGGATTNNNLTHTSQTVSQIKFNKQSAGYAFLMDALGSNNSESIEKVTRMAILGGALHGVHLVNNTASDAMHSRLGIGVSAALAVNAEREGNITISDNHQGSALWMTPMYRSYNANDLSAQGREYGTDLEVFGVVMGLDFTPMSKWRTGLMWNIGEGQADGKDVAKGINNDFDFFGLGLYTGVQLNEKFSLNADVSYINVNNKLTVDPKVTDWSTMTGDVNSKSWSVNVGAQYHYKNRNFEMIPHAGLHYSRLNLDSYYVKSDEANIARSESDIMHMWSVPLGVTFACDMAFDTWVLRPALDLTVVTNLGDISMDSKTVFDGIEGADFDYTTDVFDRFSYSATIGVSASSKQISFGINVGYTGSANTSDIMGSAQLRYVF